MLANEINDNEINKKNQVIGSKIENILKLELIFSFIDIIETIFSQYKTGVNLTI